MTDHNTNAAAVNAQHKRAQDLTDDEARALTDGAAPIDAAECVANGYTAFPSDCNEPDCSARPHTLNTSHSFAAD